jgi:anti-sigma-K factor RskA
VTEPTKPGLTHDEAIDLAAGYVLGALEPGEEAAVREHLATCDLPHPEFDELGSVVPALLELDESELVEPPAALRDRVMAAAAADLADGTSGSRPSPPAPIPFPAADERAAREERRTGTSRLDWAIRIAAVLAIVALGAWGLNLQRQLNDARAFDQAVASVVQAAGQPGAKTAILAPEKGQQGSGIAAINPDGSVVMAMHDLPPSTGGDIYTAWVIVGSQPTSLGDFEVGSNGTSGFTSGPATTPAGAKIAVTLEPNAGNTAPKGPVVSAGVATAPPAAS